ncbi:MAG: hypothetical protein K0S32_1385 [Bacteroidetes bacterium]|jgi:hypothetical protein|nr:hypothetical protein [Bacteroidota bacterium]
MKSNFPKYMLGILAVSGSLLLLSSFNLKKEKCNKEKMLQQAYPKLKQFTLIQDYPFYLRKKKKNDPVEYSKQIVTLNRGIRYKFYAIRNEEYDGVPIVSIFNNEKQEFLIGSTYSTNLKRFYEEIEFECKTTGNYCLSFSFLDGVEGCGLGIYSSLVKE